MIEAEDTYFDHKLFKSHLAQPKNTATGSRMLSSQKGGGNNSNTLIKNLDILLSGRTLQDLLIVDNKSGMYSDHVLNGIPITDYHGDQADRALFRLKDYLIKSILPAEDVR